MRHAAALPRLLAPFLLALAAALLIAAPAASASGGVAERSVDRAGVKSALDYWTAERMRAADPLAAPQVGSGATLDFPAPGPKPRALPASSRLDLSSTIQPTAPRGPGKVNIGDRPPYQSGEVPLGSQTTYPTSTNGRLFGKLRGFGGYSCSATVISSSSHSVIMTAGHCVHDQDAGFAKRVIFVPAYHRGDRPFGVWGASRLITTNGWKRIENYNYDYAAVKLRKAGGDAVGNVVGEQGVAFNQSREQTFQAIGYPFNKSRAEIMWNCIAAFAGVDPRDRFAGSPGNGIGCDMSQGASGGGWFIQDGAGGQFINSVTSFGYRAIKKVLFGPYFDRKVLKVVNAANR